MFLTILLKKKTLASVLLGALSLVTLYLLHQASAAPRSETASRTLSASWSESNPQLLPQASYGSLPQAYVGSRETSPFWQQELQPSSFYIHVSPVKESPFPFNAIGFHWEAEVPRGAQVAIEARTSLDKTTWTPWLSTLEVDALRGTGARDTDLLFSSGRYLQYRVTVSQAPEAWVPVLDEVEVTFIDSTQGPSPEDAAAASGPIYRLASLIRPQVLSRQAWGADESYKFYQGELIWPLEYAPVKKIVVHHTATRNEYEDPTEIVRAIYFYHTVKLGWGDIGYNFLIDAEGKIYEGRSGGTNVVGIHVAEHNTDTLGVALIGTFVNVDPPSQALKALEKLLLAKAVQHGVDPAGHGHFLDEDLPNIIGHRDLNNTFCPGDNIYELLPFLREQTAASLPPYGQAWLSDDIPKVLTPGDEITVDLQVLNSGTAVWENSLPKPVRVGYHWYTRDGTPYAAEPELELHTDLPRPVRPRESVTVKAILRAPSQEGQYVLKWDMVQREVTWFTEQGNVPLERVVLVAAWAGLRNEKLVNLPNEQLILLLPERLRTLPLWRLTRFSNTQLTELMPEIIQFFPNERVLSFSNDMLLRYLPDHRLKTFSFARIRTYPMHVQQRLGLAPTRSSTPRPRATVVPKNSSPIHSPIQYLHLTPTSRPGSASTPTSRPGSASTPTSRPGSASTPTSRPRSASTPTPTVTPTLTPSPTPTPLKAWDSSPYSTPSATPIDASQHTPGGAVAP